MHDDLHPDLRPVWAELLAVVAPGGRSLGDLLQSRGVSLAETYVNTVAIRPLMAEAVKAKRKQLEKARAHLARAAEEIQAAMRIAGQASERFSFPDSLDYGSGNTRGKIEEGDLDRALGILDRWDHFLELEADMAEPHDKWGDVHGLDFPVMAGKPRSIGQVAETAFALDLMLRWLGWDDDQGRSVAYAFALQMARAVGAWTRADPAQEELRIAKARIPEATRAWILEAFDMSFPEATPPVA